MHPVLEKTQRLASGYLFVGPPGSGKEAETDEFVAKLGVTGVDQIKVRPDGASIKIEQIRELQQVVRYGPTKSPYFIAVIESAEEMTMEAAGAFLKTLEEPPPKVVFILLVGKPDKIMPTIASRCQKILFGEKLVKWEPKPEMAGWYEELKQVKKKSVIELFALSAKLEKEKEQIETVLYDLAIFAKESLGDIKITRSLLDAVKNIKKRANFKLALDVACLRMNEI